MCDSLFFPVVEGPVLRGYYNFNFIVKSIRFVVEGPVLRGYYNTFSLLASAATVVEGPVLRGYYNLLLHFHFLRVLWKVRF